MLVFAAAKKLDPSKRFNNVAEAFDFILQSDETNDDEVYEITSGPSSSCDEIPSDFSLNLKTPAKSKCRRKERPAAGVEDSSQQ